MSYICATEKEDIRKKEVKRADLNNCTSDKQESLSAFLC
jgi:hypothetical protein